MCDERDQLMDYVYGEGDPETRRATEAHLQSCAACRDAVAAFGDVRQDLLAWDVPAHASVWRPFTPAAARPTWRQAPAWWLAAAASLAIVAGAAGSGLTLALTRQPAPADIGGRPEPVRSSAPSTAGLSQPAALSPDDAAALEARLLALVRAEQDRRLTADERRESRAVASAIAASETRQLNSLNFLYSDFVRVKIDQGRRLDRLQRDVLDIASAVNR